jgi:hypothetical protein
MHYSNNPEEIKTKIEKLWNTDTNIWNIKEYRTKLPLSTLFVKLKPAQNNKDIFNVGNIQQCKIFHQNVQSLNNKKLHIEVLLTGPELDVDVLCITEHWLDEKEIGYYNFDNYSYIEIL